MMARVLKDYKGKLILHTKTLLFSLFAFHEGLIVMELSRGV